MDSSDELLTSSVPRTLETKNKILGLELSDVLLLLMNLSVQNLIFGTTSMKIPMVFGSSLSLGILLFFFKSGKPDLFLQHYTNHLLMPAVLSANSNDTAYQAFRARGDV